MIYKAAKEPKGKSPDEWLGKKTTEQLLEHLCPVECSEPSDSFIFPLVEVSKEHYASVSIMSFYVLFLGQEFTEDFIVTLCSELVLN